MKFHVSTATQTNQTPGRPALLIQASHLTSGGGPRTEAGTTRPAYFRLSCRITVSGPHGTAGPHSD